MYNKLKKICPNTLKDVSLGSLTTFKIGGLAQFVCYPSCIEELINLLNFCKDNKLSQFVLGGGSNILASDTGFCGVIICTKRLNNLTLLSSCRVEAECGVLLSKLAHFCKLHGLSGVENLCGIPGTVGGAVVMNAGAFGGEISKVVESVTFVENGKIITLKKSQLFFDYRKSFFTNRQNCVILSVVLRLKKSTSNIVQKNMLQFISQRQATQGVGLPSAGCVFKKVNHESAALFIQNCGLKGARIGDAMVSNAHAGFIVNTGKATSKQVQSLIELIKSTVKLRYGVMLELELVFI